MNTEDNFVGPRRSRIGYHNIMLIRHADTGYLELSCVRFKSVAVKLIIGSIIFNPRRTTVRALVAFDIAINTMQIVGGRQFGVLDIRHGIVRPTVSTARCRRHEQTCPSGIR